MSLGCKLENLRVSYLLYLLDASATPSTSHASVDSPHTDRAAPSRGSPKRSARRGASGSLNGVHGRLVLYWSLDEVYAEERGKMVRAHSPPRFMSAGMTGA